MKRLILTALVAATALSFGCGQKTVSEGDRTAVDSVLRPDSEVHGATVYLYDGGRMTTEIRADMIRRFEAKDSTMGYKLDIDFLDSLGKISSNLVSDSGVIREKTGRLDVFSKVVVVTQDSARLDTEYLRWNPERDKIESDAYVKFTRGDNVVTGWGMEADSDLGRLKILSQVSGTVTESEVATGK
ncbi:MAG: LPS export ABC transporter periplasmic protein LptC [candidate division Zixibacteria bacterium]|nr:LPS export ABC transporter periplasmic protein LptC [candidate division Zixibacteria bacterium]